MLLYEDLRCNLLIIHMNPPFISLVISQPKNEAFWINNPPTLLMKMAGRESQTFNLERRQEIREVFFVQINGFEHAKAHKIYGF